jgi:replicative DNA helicase
MATERVVPHNLDAERAVIGCILAYGGDRLDDLLHHSPLEPKHFFRAAHQIIFRAVLALHQRRSPIDFVTVKSELERIGKINEVGGPAILGDFASGVPRSTNLPHYGGMVYQAAQRRHLIGLSTTLQADAYDEAKPISDVLDRVERDIFDVSEAVEGEQPVLSVAARVPRLIADLERIQDSDSPMTGVPTGFADLDTLTRGLQRKELILLGARPSMGKTALALNVAHHAARDGRVVAFFSMEMSGESLMHRLVAASAKIDLHKLLSGTLPPTYYGRLANAWSELNELSNLEIDDTRGLGPLQLRSKARRIKRQHGRLDLIVLDYLQLMEAPDKGYRNRSIEVGQISRLLRSTAQELDVPILALCQLNRNTEDRSDNKPRMSDLKESGSLEQDADMVLLLHREEMYEATNDNQGKATLDICKQRNGPTKEIRLYYHAEEVRFANATIAAFSGAA